MKEKLIKFSPILVALVVILILRMAEHEGQNLGNHRDIDEELKEMTESIAQSLPMQIDHYTTLDQVAAFPERKLLLTHTLSNLDPSEDIKAIEARMKERLLNQVKTRPDMEAIRHFGVSLTAAYNDEKGNELFRVTVTPKDIQPDWIESGSREH